MIEGVVQGSEEGTPQGGPLSPLLANIYLYALDRELEGRGNIFKLEGWIRRHIRCCFWQRWHDWMGRLRHLRHLGLSGHLLKVAHSSKGAWRIAASPSLEKSRSEPQALRPSIRSETSPRLA